MKLSKLAIQVREDAIKYHDNIIRKRPSKERLKKGINLYLGDNNQTDKLENQTEYRPLKTGYLNSDRQKEWQEFLERYDYDLFVTLTFREDIEHWKAQKRFEKWLGSLNKEIFGWRYRRKGLGIRCGWLDSNSSEHLNKSLIVRLN